MIVMNKEELYNYCKDASNEIIRQDEEIRKLEKKNKQLTNNWNKLKEIIKKRFIAQGGFTCYEWNDLLNELLDKMQELEKGSENE